MEKLEWTFWPTLLASQTLIFSKSLWRTSIRSSINNRISSVEPSGPGVFFVGRFLIMSKVPTMWETWGLIPWSGRASGEGNGNPLQCSCLLVMSLSICYKTLEAFYLFSIQFWKFVSLKKFIFYSNLSIILV